MDADVPFSKIDTTVPASARIWNYWLGGKDYYPVDKMAGDQFARFFPGIFDMAARPGISSRGRCATWRPRRASANSSTSEPGCPVTTALAKSSREWLRIRGLPSRQ